eukprot:gb/GECG01002261.1/.p1 GENE.gb/GECG01002261.1/~~gb/GECG01002261.1/.p1  ORF type:complete len:571 (+),score=55.20 gb/GECG01002261.1/:1-1713(+)
MLTYEICGTKDVHCSSRRAVKQTKANKAIVLLVGVAFVFYSALCAAGFDLRSKETDCIEVDESEPSRPVLRQTCTIHWEADGYDNTAYVKLRANETFDGGGFTINLTNVENFDGLFKVSNDVQSFAHAPLIKNVHTVNGSTAKYGAFIVQPYHRFFEVNYCANVNGELAGEDSAAIAASNSGFNGRVLIKHSYSTGIVTGKGAGGIIGHAAGEDGGVVDILNCSSTGNMLAEDVGGITGDNAGTRGGNVHITQCFSTGDIGGVGSGGIVGCCGANSGMVHVSECYTSGDVTANEAGGIIGLGAAQFGGNVNIKDSYTTGLVKLHTTKTGGICGSQTARNQGTVSINNVYMLSSMGRTFLIGAIHTNSEAGKVKVQHAVHNTTDGQTSATSIVAQGDLSVLEQKGNSGELANIRGQLYQPAGDKNASGTYSWSDEIWFIPNSDDFPQLRAIPETDAGPVTTSTDGLDIPAATTSPTSMLTASPSSTVFPSKRTSPNSPSSTASPSTSSRLPSSKATHSHSQAQQTLYQSRSFKGKRIEKAKIGAQRSVRVAKSGYKHLYSRKKSARGKGRK